MENSGGEEIGADLEALQTQLKNADHLVVEYGRGVDRAKELQNQILAAPMADTNAEQDLADLGGKIRFENGLIRDELLIIRKFISDPSSSTIEQLASIEHQYESLKKAFIQFTLTYKSNHTHFRDECMLGLQRHLKSSETEFTEEEVEKMIEAGNFSKCISNEAELHEHHKQYLAEAEARHKSLAKVQTSLDELHEIMAKFNSVFEVQSEALDDAEYRILLESKNVEDTKEKLKQKTGFNG